MNKAAAVDLPPPQPPQPFSSLENVCFLKNPLLLKNYFHRNFFNDTNNQCSVNLKAVGVEPFCQRMIYCY